MIHGNDLYRNVGCIFFFFKFNIWVNVQKWYLRFIGVNYYLDIYVNICNLRDQMVLYDQKIRGK